MLSGMSLARIGLLLGTVFFGGSYVATGSFWPFGKKDEAKPDDGGGDGGKKPIGYDEIADTTIVDLEGVGKVRFFDPDVTATILQNLAGAYTFDDEGTFKPEVGVDFTYLQHYDPVGYPPVGSRAFDWVQMATESGYYVLMVARAGSGPWAQIDGNNEILLVTAADLTNPAIVNDWAIIAEPGSLSSTLASMPTEDLLAELGKA
jgi:hypothetical protein